jgi:hypothetical protein
MLLTLANVLDVPLRERNILQDDGHEQNLLTGCCKAQPF